jgi:hypothetical protein
MNAAQTGRTHDLRPTASRKPKESLGPWAPSTHDIDTAAVGSLKALDPKWPIREADIRSARQRSLFPLVGEYWPVITLGGPILICEPPK